MVLHGAVQPMWKSVPQQAVLARQRRDMSIMGIAFAVFLVLWIRLVPLAVGILFALASVTLYIYRFRKLIRHQRKYKDAHYEIRDDKLVVADRDGVVVETFVASTAARLRLVKHKAYVNLEWKYELRSDKGGTVGFPEGFLYLDSSEELLIHLTRLFPGRIDIQQA